MCIVDFAVPLCRICIDISVFLVEEFAFIYKNVFTQLSVLFILTAECGNNTWWNSNAQRTESNICFVFFLEFNQDLNDFAKDPVAQQLKGIVFFFLSSTLCSFMIYIEKYSWVLFYIVTRAIRWLTDIHGCASYITSHWRTRQMCACSAIYVKCIIKTKIYTENDTKVKGAWRECVRGGKGVTKTFSHITFIWLWYALFILAEAKKL